MHPRYLSESHLFFVFRRDISILYILIINTLFTYCYHYNYCITVYADKIGPATGVHFRRIHVSFFFFFFFYRNNYVKESYHDSFSLFLLFGTLNPT